MGSATCKALPLPWHRSQPNRVCMGNNSSDSGSNVCTTRCTAPDGRPTQDASSTLRRLPCSSPHTPQRLVCTTNVRPFVGRSLSCGALDATGQNENRPTQPCSLPQILPQRSNRPQAAMAQTPARILVALCTVAQDACAVRNIVTPESVSFTASGQGLSSNTTPYTCNHALSVDEAGQQARVELDAPRLLGEAAPLPGSAAEDGGDAFSLCSESSDSQAGTAFPLLAMTRCARAAATATATSVPTPSQPFLPSVAWACEGDAVAADARTPPLQSLQRQPDFTIREGAVHTGRDATLTAVQSGSVLTAQPPPNTHGFARSLLDCSFDSRALGDPCTGPAAAERLARRAGSPSQHEFTRDSAVETVRAQDERQLSVVDFVNFFNGLSKEVGGGGAPRGTALRWFRVCDEARQTQRPRPNHRTRSETRIRWAPYEYYEDDPHTPGYPYSTASSYPDDNDDASSNKISNNETSHTVAMPHISADNVKLPLREMRCQYCDDGDSPLQPSLFVPDKSPVVRPIVDNTGSCADTNKAKPQEHALTQPVRRRSVVSLHPCGTWKRHHVVPIFVDHSPAAEPLAPVGDKSHKVQSARQRKANDPLLDEPERDESDLSFSCTSSSCPQLSSGAESSSLKATPSFEATEHEGHGAQFSVIVPSSAPAPYLSVVLPSMAADNADGNPFCCSEDHPVRRRAASDSSSCAAMQQQQLQRLRNAGAMRPVLSKPQKPIIPNDVPFRQQLAKRASQDYELFMLLRRKGDVALLEQME